MKYFLILFVAVFSFGYSASVADKQSSSDKKLINKIKKTNEANRRDIIQKMKMFIGEINGRIDDSNVILSEPVKAETVSGISKSSHVHYINGMDSGDNPMFYRDENRSAPDNAYIKFSSILDKANEEGWMDKTQTIKPFKFRDAEWKAAQKEAKAEAKDTIKKLQDSDDPDDVKAVEAAKALVAEPEKSSTIKVSSNGTVGGFDYDSETKQYAHTQYNEPMIDKETGEQLKVDNVIVQRVHSDIMVDAETGTSDEKGRLEIDMYAGGDAMLFTQGQVVNGSWSRKDSSSRTIFRDENGEQFRLTPGHTWVLVLDQNYDLEY